MNKSYDYISDIKLNIIQINIGNTRMTAVFKIKYQINVIL